MNIALTDEQVDIINHAIVQTYFFDGWDEHNDDHPPAAALLVALGFHDRRSEAPGAHFLCSECGRVGTAEDLCFDGEPCPDEDCAGTCTFIAP